MVEQAEVTDATAVQEHSQSKRDAFFREVLERLIQPQPSQEDIAFLRSNGVLQQRSPRDPDNETIIVIPWMTSSDESLSDYMGSGKSSLTPDELEAKLRLFEAMDVEGFNNMRRVFSVNNSLVPSVSEFSPAQLVTLCMTRQDVRTSGRISDISVLRDMSVYSRSLGPKGLSEPTKLV